MPELPEVETVMQGLMPFISGAVINDVDQRRPDLRIPFPDKMKKRLEGRKVTALYRRAKYIIIVLDNAENLVIHLGMSGRILIARAEEANSYPLKKHDHLIITLKDGVKIIYNDPRRFGMIFMVANDEIETHPRFKDLGPEPLGNEFSAPTLIERLKGKKSPIKQALLDQRVVVGIGNIYACEALFQAGIHPALEAGKLTMAQAEKLTHAITDVLTRAIKAGGSTLKDYRHVNDELGYFQHNFHVYDQEKKPCGLCDCDIDKTLGVKRIVQSGRSTFYCPQKQKKQ